MSFLQPWGLLLAGLATVPILLHLLRRQVVQRVAFPALRYLRNAEQRTARTLRLRDLLLLMSRIVLILLLAVAAARPLAGRGGAGDHAPTDAILIIDNTASMGGVRGGRTLLDLQLDAARAALEQAGPSDRFWVLPAAGPQLAAGVGAESALRALDSISGGEADADLVGRVELATSAVPVEDGRVREVQLYTDGQASGLRGDGLDLSGWGSVAVSRLDADAPTNGFVSDLRLEPDGTVIPGDPPAVAVAVGTDAAPGEEERAGDTVEVRLLVDGRTVAMSRVTFGNEVLVPLPDVEAGAHVVRAELPPTGLRADDARQLGIVAEEAPVVRLAGDGEGFLGAALETLAADGRVREAGDDPVHVLEGGGGVPAGGRALVLVPPAELTRIPAFQQRLDALGIPWRLAGRSEGGEIGLEGVIDVPGLADVRISTAHHLERSAAPTTEDDSVLLRTVDGAPWLVRGRAGGRVFLLLASPLHPDATDLPVGAAMVPFVERLVLYWSRPAANPTRAVDAGSTLILPSRIEGLLTPAGDTAPAEGGAPWTPLRAGTWTFLLPGDDAPVEQHVGVNVPSAESDLQPASEDQIRAAFAGSEIRIASSPEAWEDTIFGARRGAEATPWVVGGILLLALVELLIAAPGRRRSDSAPEPA